jgi:hypothetical protein
MYQTQRKFQNTKSKMKMMISKMKEDRASMKSIRAKMNNFRCNSKSLEVILNNNLLKRLSNLFKKIWLKINLRITKCQLHLYSMNFCKHSF